MGHYMIKHLDRAAKKTNGYICVSKVISIIALHLGVNTEGFLPDLGGEPMDFTFLKRARMIEIHGLRSFRTPTRYVLLQRDKDDFPLPHFALTYVNGPEQQANWGMNTQAHRAHRTLTEDGDAGQGPSSSSSEEDEEEEEQPESSSRAKRSRPRASTSSDDRLRTLVEGMSILQLGQGQHASFIDRVHHWYREELDWRVGVNAELAT